MSFWGGSWGTSIPKHLYKATKGSNGITGPERGRELMLSKTFKLRLANHKWPSWSAVMLWAGPVELAARGLYLNEPNLSAVP